MSTWVNYLTTVWTKHIEPTNASPSSYFIPTNRNNASFSCAFRTFSLSLQPYDDYIIQTSIILKFRRNNMNSKRTILNEAQIELLDLVSIINSKEELEGLRKVIMDYLASQLKGEIDRLWDNGTLNDQKVESFRTLHERTPYNKAAIPC